MVIRCGTALFMRWAVILAMIAVVVMWMIVVVVAQSEDVAAQAADAYSGGRYGEAIQIYESMVASGEASGALYYNLGNAYFHAGQMGRALLNYRRAQWYLPRDSDIDAAVARVVSQRRDVIGDDPRLLAQAAQLTAEVLTVQELAWVTLIFWMLFCALAMTWVVRRSKRSPWTNGAFGRGRRQRVLLGTGAALSAAVLLLVARMTFEAAQPTGVVVVDQSLVMSGPGEGYLHLYDLFEAAEVYILEERGGWVRFGLADGQQGWMSANAIEALFR